MMIPFCWLPTDNSDSFVKKKSNDLFSLNNSFPQYCNHYNKLVKKNCIKIKKRRFRTIPVSASPNDSSINIDTMRISKKMKSPSIVRELIVLCRWVILLSKIV